MAERKKLECSTGKACAVCPWRLANAGKPHPHKFYAAANLRRLWRGIRDGERMTCHPTDPQMEEFEGYEKTADRDVTRECAGAQTLVQRELAYFTQAAKDFEAGKTEDAKSALQFYRRRRPRGLTRAGLAGHFFAAVMTMPGAPPMRKVPLADDEVGYALLGEFEIEQVPDAVQEMKR